MSLCKVKEAEAFASRGVLEADAKDDPAGDRREDHHREDNHKQDNNDGQRVGV